MPNFTIPLELLAITPDRADISFTQLARAVAEAIQGGVSAVVFREKSLADDVFIRRAKELRKVVVDAGACFILNERDHLLGEIEACALQLSFRSSPLSEVKKRYGANLPIGVSVHNPAEAQKRAEAGADFLIYGPVFETPSKKGLVSLRGLDELESVCEHVTCPVVAVGGVDDSRAEAVARTGAAGLAVMRFIFDAADPQQAAVSLRRSWGHHGN
ncbi:MAG: thiamine phosphate synthase [Planctomycetota bacterium]